MTIFDKARQWARRIKRDAVALWFAYRHPGTPLLAKGLCIFVVAYALSPIDLIPDFIPVLGYVDDVLLLPALIWLAVRMVPDTVLDECRTQGDAWLARKGRKPVNYWGAALVLAAWVGLAWACWVWFGRPGM